MENASKALIIAGAILISIVIITLGVMIVNNVTDTINKNANLSAQEVAQYNAEFLSYEGRRTGSQVRALLNTISSHNRSTWQDDNSRIVIVQDTEITDPNHCDVNATWGITTTDGGNSLNDNVQTILTNVRSGFTYNVSFGYDSHSGLITTVAIVQQ